MDPYIFPTYESYYSTMNSKICKNRTGPSLKLSLIFRYLVNITSCDLGGHESRHNSFVPSLSFFCVSLCSIDTKICPKIMCNITIMFHKTSSIML